MKIAIGGDHAGFSYKLEVVKFLEKKGYTVEDKGPFSEDSVDYPDYVHPVAEEVASGKVDKGILICGSGNGVCMTANKHEKIRAALCWQNDIARLSRQHNDANIICIPARYTSMSMAIDMVDIFLHTEFEGGRHQKRVDKIPMC